MQTIERTAEAPFAGGHSMRKIMAIIIVLMVAAVAGGWWLFRGDSEMSATDVLQNMATAMRDDDMDLLTETVGPDDDGFLEWQIGWNAQPVFSDVTETELSADLTRVNATVTYGDDSFYAQVVGKTLTTEVTGTVDQAGIFEGSSWQPPRELMMADLELRNWIKENRPELEPRMFDCDEFACLLFTRESGELRMEVLDDFMASR